VNRPEIHAKLEGIFRTLFDDPTLQLQDATTAKDVKNWDSITHIDLICMVEDEFGIQFTTREVANLANVGELISVIERKAVE
jgi:acyl carrier protein